MRRAMKTRSAHTESARSAALENLPDRSPTHRLILMFFTDAMQMNCMTPGCGLVTGRIDSLGASRIDAVRT
jgi:hypothetical protein